MYKFDLLTERWTRLDPLGYTPSPREGHVGKLIGENLVIHGGLSDNNNFNDVYVLTGLDLLE